MRWLSGLRTAIISLTAKLVNFAFFAAAAVLLYAIARRETRDRLFSLTVLALFLANYYLLRSVIEASNYTIPIACTLAAYYLFHSLYRQPQAGWAFFFAGLLLGAAVGAKLYYATLVHPLRAGRAALPVDDEPAFAYHFRRAASWRAAPSSAPSLCSTTLSATGIASPSTIWATICSTPSGASKTASRPP